MTHLTHNSSSNSDPTVAQKWRMARYGTRNKQSALDSQGLRDLALAYVGRYATSREKLCRYLGRKLRERGWEGEGEPEIEALASRFVELGYIDDGAYARMKGAGMERRGLGARRIGATLRADGIGERDSAEALDHARSGAWDAAAILARKRRIGPYAAELADAPTREKQIAAFLRAGHSFATARAWVHAAPGEFPDNEFSNGANE